MEKAFEALKQFYGQLDSTLEGFNDAVMAFFAQLEKAGAVYTFIVRWVFPIMAIAIFIRCALPLLHKGKRGKAWGYLRMENGTRFPLLHWENSIGRGKLSDVLIDLPVISRSHAVLAFRKGAWHIFDLESKGGVEVNGKKIDKFKALEDNDIISLAGVKLVLLPADMEYEDDTQINSTFKKLSKYGRHMTSGVTLLIIILFQLLGALQLCFSMKEEFYLALPVSVIVFILTELIYFVFARRHGGKYLELEMLAFFLCGLCLMVVGSSSPDSIYKQLISIILGIISFSVFKGLIGNINRARKLKYIFAACSLLLLALNLVIGEYRFGAKNWIDLGFMSFQPSEFVKVAFVLAGTATLDRLLTTKNLTKFIIFSGACLGSLVLMRDLGTALIFFVAFLVIAFMRSGDYKTIGIICGGAVVGAVAAIFIMPYIASRFASWGRVWEFANSSGFQQTRTMIYAASGGLLGVGGGNGYFINIPAADTDLVFGLLCEEWGLIIGITVVLIMPFIAIFSALLVKKCRSSFYAVAACGAASIFIIQTALNVFGSVDLLPLTGVTLPFVSNGGTSMIASWCLLAFIKSADERRRPELEDIIMEDIEEENNEADV